MNKQLLLLLIMFLPFMASANNTDKTFEVESGDRMELRVPSNEYGYLIVGDQGDLSFQGTRCLSFNRKF